MCPQELLDFVAHYHMLLDPINLVTCLYRLAKMSFSQRSRNAYLLELQRAPTFQLLLREWGHSEVFAGRGRYTQRCDAAAANRAYCW